MPKETHIIDRIYLPEYCLQGEEIPVYILWDNEKVVIIKISHPTTIKIKEVFNSQDESLEINETNITINNVDINGYIGLLFVSELIDESTLHQELIFELIDTEGNSQIESRLINTFRPDVKLIHCPKEITVKKRDDRIIISDQIELQNFGDGTAQIDFEIDDDNSSAEKVNPSGMGEFLENFIEDLSIKLSDLMDAYPDYSNEIISFNNLNKNPPSIDEDGLEEIKESTQSLIKIMNNDNDFREEFIGCIITSYMRNLYIITEVDSFLTFIESIGEGRMLLFDAISVLKFDNSDHIIQGYLNIADLALNSYEPIDIPKIIIHIEDDIEEIPIFKFIKSRKGHLGGDECG
jgi:hypothetical protein